MTDSAAEPAPISGSVKDTARIVAWGAGIWAGLHLIGGMLARSAMGAAAAQAVGAEWAVGRLGVAWSDPFATPPKPRDIAKRFLNGALAGAAAGSFLIALLLATHGATFENGHFSAGAVITGLLTPLLFAMRDELVLHGLVLRALVGVPNTWLKIGACALASAAAMYGEGQGTAPEMIAAGGLGALCGALWVRDRGAWRAFGIHAAWSWTTGSLAHGDIVDARPALNGWGGGDAGITGGWAAAIVGLVLAGVAVGVMSRKTAQKAPQRETADAEPRA